jgi:hypothetical protein
MYLASNLFRMPRITVDVSILTYQYIEGLKTQRGSSISFEAQQLLEQAIRERNRKKKPNDRTEADNHK